MSNDKDQVKLTAALFFAAGGFMLLGAILGDQVAFYPLAALNITLGAVFLGKARK